MIRQICILTALATLFFGLETFTVVYNAVRLTHSVQIMLSKCVKFVYNFEVASAVHGS